jgi:hypothetical protein
MPRGSLPATVQFSIERLRRLAQGETFLPVHDVRMEFCRLKVFENTVLRGIFGPKREDVPKGWKMLHSEELYNLKHSVPFLYLLVHRK